VNGSSILASLSRHAAPPPGGFLPTGSVSLDILLGGGWSTGEISEIHGPPGSSASRLAYRTIAAVQRAFPDEPVILCTSAPDLSLACELGIRPGTLWLTSRPETALRHAGNAVLVVFDDPGMMPLPPRADTAATVLAVTSRPRAVRSGTCVRLEPYDPPHWWFCPELLWSSLPPQAARLHGILVSSGSLAFLQELLDTAVLLGVVTVRGRWYACGRARLGGSWEEAVRSIGMQPALRGRLLGSIAGSTPVYARWQHAYM
jgi:hypothetical protein